MRFSSLITFSVACFSSENGRFVQSFALAFLAVAGDFGRNLLMRLGLGGFRQNGELANSKCQFAEFALYLRQFASGGRVARIAPGRRLAGFGRVYGRVSCCERR